MGGEVSGYLFGIVLDHPAYILATGKVLHQLFVVFVAGVVQQRVPSEVDGRVNVDVIVVLAQQIDQLVSPACCHQSHDAVLQVGVVNYGASCVAAHVVGCYKMCRTGGWFDNRIAISQQKMEFYVPPKYEQVSNRLRRLQVNIA